MRPLAKGMGTYELEPRSAASKAVSGGKKGESLPWKKSLASTASRGVSSPSKKNSSLPIGLSSAGLADHMRTTQPGPSKSAITARLAAASMEMNPSASALPPARS